MYSLRLATKSDYSFLRELNEITMKEYIIQAYGYWDEEVEENFFKESFENVNYHIILVNGESIGCLAITQNDLEIFVNEIQILPQYQHRGTGRLIFESIIGDSNRLGIPVNLEVLQFNKAAQEFYSKIGFIQTGETKTHYLMSRKPNISSGD